MDVVMRMTAAGMELAEALRVIDGGKAAFGLDPNVAVLIILASFTVSVMELAAYLCRITEPN